jgi:hypothetical protein
MVGAGEGSRTPVSSLGIQLAFVNKEQMRPWRLILTIEVNGVSATYTKSALKAVFAVIEPMAI